MKKLVAALAMVLSVAATAHAKGVVLNFSDVDVSVMAKFMSDLTGKNIFLDERVKGKVSVYSPTKLSNDEAFSAFCSVLEMKGFSVISSGKNYQIVPSGDAKQAPVTSGFGSSLPPHTEGFVAQIVPLEHVSAQDAVAFFKPLVSKDGHVSTVAGSNSFLVVDSAANIKKVLSFLKYIDVAQEKDRPELLPLRYAASENVAKIVREWLGSRDKARASSGGQSEAVGVFADPRTNGIVISGREDLKREVKRFVSVFDIPVAENNGAVNVYYCEFADAGEVAKVVDSIIKGGAPSAANASSGVQAALFEGGRIVVTPDKATNALVVVAAPADYKTILSVIQKLDRKRRQVYVQAVIAEVSQNKLNELGVEFGAVGGADGRVSVAGVFDPFSMAAAATAPQQLLVQALQGMTGNVRISAQAKALYTSGAINILSTPTIMTADNQPAEIFVGENVPYVTSSSLTSTGMSQQSVERRDTGITLKITPQINVGNSVKLDVYQEISAVKPKTTQAVDLITTKRSTKTAVIVPNAETVLIGGLIQDTVTEQENKVPLLGDIPLLGWFFKSKSASRDKTNLLIMLTPRIVDGADDVRSVTSDARRGFEAATGSGAPARAVAR